MKFNLKNRPSGNAPISREAYRKWFNGFEEELRDLLLELEDQRRKGVTDPNIIRGFKDAINGVLGE